MADARLRILLFGEDRSASKVLKGVRKSAGEAEGSLSSLGKGVGKGLGAVKAGIIGIIGSEIVGGIKGVVDTYSQLEDSTAAASVVFGKSMGKITAQAETASTKLGMTKQQVIDAASVFGTYGKSAGLSGDKLAGFSTKMTSLAGDMASFKGTSPEQAIEAIGAALRGETEPIRAYGVMLDDATLKSQAMKMGLIKTTKEALTPQQKVLAAQAQILKQTSDAQGDFGRTADSTANVAKTASAKWTDFQAMLGEKMAPAVTGLTKAGIGLLDWLDANPKVVEGASAAFDLLGTALGAIWDIVRKYVLPAFGFLGKMEADAIRGVAGLVDAWNQIPILGDLIPDDAGDKLRGFAEGVDTVAEGLQHMGDDPVKVDVDTKLADDKMKKIDAKVMKLSKQAVKLKSEGDTKGADKIEAKIRKLQKQKNDIKIGVGLKPKGHQKATFSIARGGATGSVRFTASGHPSIPSGVMTMLGDGMGHSPELVQLPTGSRVLSAGQTMAARNQQGSGGRAGQVNNIYVSGDTNPNAAARRIHRKLAQTNVAYGPGWRPVKGR